MSENGGATETPGPERGTPSAANWTAGTAVLGALGAILAGVFLAIPVALIEPDFGTDEADPAANIAAQIASVAGFVIVSVLIAARGNLSVDWTTLRQRLGLVGFKASALGWTALAFFGYLTFLGIYAQVVGVPEQDDIAGFFGPLGFQILLIVVFASISEEVCFRGMLFGGLRNGFGPLPAALISGAVFGALHATSGLSAVPPLIVLGIALALLFEKTGSIVPGILLHALNNSLALLVA